MHLVPEASTSSRKGTCNYKQVSEPAPVLWICISPLFKAANDDRQKGFEFEVSAHVILKESFHIYTFAYCSMTSSSVCPVSATAALLSGLVLSHPVPLLSLINTECIQDTRQRGLLKSLWHGPSSFFCQPWPVAQAFYSGCHGGNATLVCESMCWSQGLEEHEFIWSSTGFVEWRVNPCHD